MQVDAHHHLWRYNSKEFEWIDASMAKLRRDFLPAELAEVTAIDGVDATVVVQARQSMEETQWLLEVAAATPLIHGVVGWLPLSDPRITEKLEQFAAEAWLKGLRHVVQAEAPGFLDRPDFNAGINAMRGTGLTYDLLVVESQLEETVRFVDRHPHQVFVVDHFAKPRVGADSFDHWASGIRELARREQVTMKVSGLVTEANWDGWTPGLLTPYWDAVLEAFTPARLMYGSDWPVLTVASSYARWREVVATWIAPLSMTERRAIEGDVAAEIYHL